MAVRGKVKYRNHERTVGEPHCPAAARTSPVLEKYRAAAGTLLFVLELHRSTPTAPCGNHSRLFLVTVRLSVKQKATQVKQVKQKVNKSNKKSDK